MQQRNLTVTLECFVKKDNKYLMLQRNLDKRIMPGVWMAPGGKREFNEGVFEATKREIFEETGLKIKNIKVKSIGCGYLEDLDLEVHFHHLVADYKSGNLHQNPSDGVLKWLTKKEILALPNLLAELKYTIPIILGNTNKIISYTCVYDKANHMTQFNLESSK